MLNWNSIDTVLLDMDGTVIDQRYDNHIFQDAIPEAIAARDNRPLDAVRQQAQATYLQYRGTLNFYCLDFWEKLLSLDIRAMKKQFTHLLQLRTGVETFLEALVEMNKRVFLVTNDHPYSMQLKIQHLGISDYFSRCISVHELGLPKEEHLFWDKLQTLISFEPAKTLFIDDTISMLDSAKAYHIEHLYAVKRPDSLQGEKETGDYFAVDNFEDLLPSTEIPKQSLTA